MGVFEMVVVLTVLSYGFQLAKIHLESRGNGSANAAPTENKVVAAAQIGNAPADPNMARKSKRRKRRRWRWALGLLGCFCCFNSFRLRGRGS